MSKQQYESNVKTVPYAQSCVYTKLSDLNNLAVIKERMDDPAVRSMMEGQMPAENVDRVRETVSDMRFDTDSVTCRVSALGDVSLRIIDREEPKCIKFETENSPISVNLWIQLLPLDENTCKMRLTIAADLNIFMKGMLEKPLKEGVEKLADMLSALPYGA